MSGFSELIKNFDKTRDYVRDFFIYGFKVRNEFNRKSARTYDDEKRRVESWLDGFLSYGSTGRGKQVSISVDSSHILENPLYSAYYSKSFTDNDIKLHFLLCDLLSGEKLGVREITERLNNDYGELFDEQTVRGKLREYADEGILLRERNGRSDLFTLSPDTAESFFGNYKGLDDAVKFFSESQEFGVVGNSLMKTAGMKNELFIRKHNYIAHTLEDGILLEILDAIERKRIINAANFNGTVSTENIGIPLKIFVSTATGRRYLVMSSSAQERFRILRLDYIKSIKDVGEALDFDLRAEELQKSESSCFGVSFGKKQEYPYGKIKITFAADENTEKFIINRLEREKRCGTVEKTGENLFTYTAEVFDANEMMGWVKSFTGRIVSIEGMNDDITGRFRSDIARMRKMYGTGEEK